MAEEQTRPHADLDIRHLELGVRGAQSALRRARVMRSDAAGKVEVVLRGDQLPSRIRIKDRGAFGLSDDQAATLEDALKEALHEAVTGVHEEQRRQFAKLLPTQGAESGPAPFGSDRTPEGDT